MNAPAAPSPVAPHDGVARTEAPRPELLFYCQHSLGLGHLVRSLALAEGLAEHFSVTLLNGGRLPEGTAAPHGVEIVNLPPLGHDDSYELVSHDDAYTVDEAKAIRTQMIMERLARRPRVVLVELYPFGRKKFAFELEPLLRTARSLGDERPLVVCSVRDILVRQRRDQERHDNRASVIANTFFDAIVMHSDPAFATLEESFTPATPLLTPVHYSGFVTNSSSCERVDDPQRRVVVSAGGGMVGEPLFRAAVDAHRIWADQGLATTIVAGPFAPDDVWTRLVEQAAASAHLDVVRSVADLRQEMADAVASVSQCGYNTTMDILRADVAAVVVPYAEGKEDEQRRRATLLQRAGVLSMLDPAELSGAALADAVLDAIGSRSLRPPAAGPRLDLDGRTRTAEIIAGLAGLRQGIGGQR
jgi:predicted glycosyltransferase